MNESYQEITQDITQEIATAKRIVLKEGCCKSYLTSKGRCYTCPEEDNWPED